jgi:N4-gp56 family major capsid protein
MSMELIQRAYEANSFNTTQAEAQLVNPDYWDKRVMDHVKANLVALQFSVDKSSLLVDGDTLKVTILEEPLAASAVAESAKTAISKFDLRQVEIEPTEYSAAYQLTDKEMRRAFFNVMESMAQKLGYRLARKADDLAIAELQKSTVNQITAGGVVSSAIASSNRLSFRDVMRAVTSNELQKHTQHIALIVNPVQAMDLSLDPAFQRAGDAGPGVDAANRNGYVGRVGGLSVYRTTQIPVGTNKAKAILISDPEAFGHVFKPTGGIQTQYHARNRLRDFVSTIDFDVSLFRPKAVCNIETWAAL